MFDFVHQKRRIVQIILALAALPFLFWGIESYRSGEGDDYLALAAGEKIQRQEFDQALRNQQEGMRATMGERFNDSMLENPEVKAAVLEGLIQQRLLKHEAAHVGLVVPDPQLIEMIQNISAFQEDGKFSKQRYEELLRAQGMSPRTFEARVRQELMRQDDASALKNVVLFNDFFTTSECRDLLFHVQEHRMTLPAIKQFLAENNMQFLGFDPGLRLMRHYAARFPDDKAMVDLDHWHAFEQDNPYTFASMYCFWVQKA